MEGAASKFKPADLVVCTNCEPDQIDEFAIDSKTNNSPTLQGSPADDNQQEPKIRKARFTKEEIFAAIVKLKVSGIKPSLHKIYAMFSQSWFT